MPPPIPIDGSTAEFINDHRIAHLATADASGAPAVVPVCYAFDGESIYSALDEKPKSVGPLDLTRVRNIESNRRVSLVIDDYDEDWSKLAYAHISGVAEIIEPDGAASAEHNRAVELLRAKYPQYHSMAIEKRPIIKITPVRAKLWRSRTRLRQATSEGDRNA
jgi:PPOX class probable F420-dependent enzyme